VGEHKDLAFLLSPKEGRAQEKKKREVVLYLSFEGG